MNKDLMITSQDLIDWLDRPPSNDDLDLISFITVRLEKFYDLVQENKEKDRKIEERDNIINELEKWLEEKQAFYGINQQGFSWGVCGEALDRLRELKDGVIND